MMSLKTITKADIIESGAFSFHPADFTRAQTELDDLSQLVIQYSAESWMRHIQHLRILQLQGITAHT